MATDVREPFLRVMSPKVRVFFGFKDARAELKVMTPLKVEVPATIPAEKVAAVKKAFDAAYGVAMLPESDRAKVKEEERVIDDRAKVVFGYPDGGGKICVRPIRLSPWIPIGISREELLDAKKTVDEIFQWLELPEEIRNLQGVP
jgi:hypothetical protein